MNRRLISFGKSTIGLEYGHGRPADLVDFLFQKIPDSKTEKPWALLRLEDHGEDDGLWLWQDETLLFKESSSGSMANHLMSQVCFTLAYESRDGLLLHSAAVQMSGLGIMLPGKSGAGKSTLTAWFLGHGGRYLTDEMVYIATESDVISGFARPITIKAPARSLLLELLKENRAAGGMLGSEPVDIIDPELFGAEVVKGDSPLDLIIFPRYRPGQKVEIRQLSKALTAFELMKCLANARNLTDHGFSEAVRLAAAAPAYSLSYGDTEQAGRSVTQLLQNQP
jgi:hypothetical protein